MSARRPRIWVLLGHRRGDNNQLLALAEGLRLPFETRTLTYRKFWPIFLKLFPAHPHVLTSDARRNLQPPWPDLVIATGSLIPLELYETLYHFGWIKLATAIGNVAIIVYLVRIALQPRVVPPARERHHTS